MDGPTVAAILVWDDQSKGLILIMQSNVIDLDRRNYNHDNMLYYF